MFRGALEMRRICPSCGLVLEREPGYFTGAMVVAYAIAVVVYGGLALALWAVGIPLAAALVGSAVVLIVAAPAIFRYSRVVWMHLDHAIDPEG